MTYTAGFNAGVEAAAKRLREISHEGLQASWWRERFESAARSVESLKRPEPSEAELMPWPVINTIDAAGAEIPPKIQPSEADTQKIGKAMREAVRNVCKGPTLSDELTDEQCAALFRAALKAMEVE